jgi:hypothetical protein
MTLSANKYIDNRISLSLHCCSLFYTKRGLSSWEVFAAPFSEACTSSLSPALEAGEGPEYWDLNWCIKVIVVHNLRIHVLRDGTVFDG